MKKLYILLPLVVLLFTACSKRDYYNEPEVNIADWMRSHDHGVVAYVDYATGNYIIETHSGYSVIENWGGVSPREFDDAYAYFSNRGVQTIYNYTGNYFTKGMVVESWLSWSDALYIIDDLRYQGY